MFTIQINRDSALINIVTKPGISYLRFVSIMQRINLMNVNHNIIYYETYFTKIASSKRRFKITHLSDRLLSKGLNELN